MTTPDRTQIKKSRAELTREFDRVVGRAHAALFWERLWPRLVPSLAIGGLFLSVSWLGLWTVLSPLMCVIGVTAFGAAILAAPLLVCTKTLNVSDADALRRLDENTGDPTRPAQTLRDKLNERNPPVAQEVWDLHLQDMWDKWGGKFEAGKPRPAMDKRDPHHLRHIALLITVAAAVIAGDQREPRLNAAFKWAVKAPLAPLPVKAWITPPDGMNVMAENTHDILTEATRDHTLGGQALSAHERSTLTILTFGRPARVMVNGAELPAKTLAASDKKGLATYQYQTTLNNPATIVTIQDGPKAEPLTWRIAVTPDNDPSATLKSLGTVKDNPLALELEYKTDDDFGVRSTDAVIKPANTDPAATPLPAGQLPPIPLP